MRQLALRRIRCASAVANATVSFLEMADLHRFDLAALFLYPFIAPERFSISYNSQNVQVRQCFGTDSPRFQTKISGIYLSIPVNVI
ncbi:hypothetical protein PSP6_690089 [Paraburkholderia tropica]|nr:hypothetical protein PSP6_690089 [Paraburkholderia tropica]